MFVCPAFFTLCVVFRLAFFLFLFRIRGLVHPLALAHGRAAEAHRTPPERIEVATAVAERYHAERP